jgi:hypothetical protein
MRSQARVLQYIPIPVQRVRCTNTVTTPSIWQRARAAVSSAVSQVRSVVARVVAAIARKVTGARASIARVARAAMVRRPWVLTRDGAGYAASRASSWLGDAWRRVGRPFMRVRVAVLGIGAVVVGLVISPITTLVVLAGCGAALVGLSKLISVLETSRHSAARFTLVAIEWVARAGRVLAYAAAAAVVTALCFVSVAFAATEVLELVLRYLDVAGAASIAALAFFLLTANWGLAAIEVAWLALVHTDSRRARTRAQERQEIPLIRIDAERAWRGEEIVDIVPGTAEPLATEKEMQEMMDMIDEAPADILAVFASAEDARRFGAPVRSGVRTGKCMGCDLDDGGVRFGIGQLSVLCDQCFSFLIEDELVNAAEAGQVSAEDVVLAIDAGIQVPASVVIASGARLRSTRIDLDVEDVTCRTAARTDSEKDSTKVYWAETAWWFDGRSNRRARRWHGFVGGRLVVRVEYEHARGERGFYAMSLTDSTPDSWDQGPYRTLAAAQVAAADEVSDSQIANAPSLGAAIDLALRSVS